MKHQKHRTRMIALAALFSTTTLIAAAGAMTYEITVENAVTPGGMEMGQPFSRPVAVVHGAGYSQWAPGGQASPGLELVAREGNPTVLAMEAENNADVYDVVVGGSGPFFDSVAFSVEGDPGDLFSIAWMLGRTNDLFAGLHDVALPVQGVDVQDAEVWDSGTEVNTGMIEDLGFYGNPNTGPDEDAPITSVSYTHLTLPTSSE
ncbi:MAG: spondin domain-containing protein, partial [Candidatus Eisenbacteria bacterium]|nr:spondin domain-containing protein [Candidatus Eisenbacteria bacterium]